DGELVALLGAWGKRPLTYAGGASALAALAALELVDRLGQGRVDLTIGSALDLFGGTGVRYEDCVAWNRGEGEADLSPALVRMALGQGRLSFPSASSAARA